MYFYKMNNYEIEFPYQLVQQENSRISIRQRV